MPGRVSDDGALFISSHFRQTDDMKNQRDALAFCGSNAKNLRS